MLPLSPPRSPRSIYTDVNHIFRKELFKKNLGVGRTYLFARLGDLLRKCLKPNRPFHKHRLLFEVDIKLAHLACSNGTIVSHKTGYIVIEIATMSPNVGVDTYLRLVRASARE